MVYRVAQEMKQKIRWVKLYLLISHFITDPIHWMKCSQEEWKIIAPRHEGVLKIVKSFQVSLRGRDQRVLGNSELGEIYEYMYQMW